MFLPAAGYRIGVSISSVNANGSYWNVTLSGNGKSYQVGITATGLWPNGSWPGVEAGQAVRLASVVSELAGVVPACCGETHS